MPSMAYSIGVLLALACATVMQGCRECHSSCGGTTQRPVTLHGDEWMAHGAPGDLLHSVAGGCQGHDQLVKDLLQRMEKSVHFDEPPNASILLAMNLAGDTHGHVHSWLLQAIKNYAVNRAQKDMTSGQVALYVLALLSSCQDPRHVHANGKTINLIPILKQKMNEEISKNVITWYRESLDILALCLVQDYDYQDAAMAVAEELLHPKSHIIADTQAMAVLALVCAYRHTDSDRRRLIYEALHKVTNHFLDEQEKNNGMIGNIYSMGLALQALETSSEFYAPRKWNSSQACNVVYNHDYHQPMAIAQVLPPLVGKSYLNAGKLGCAATNGMAPSQQLPQSPTPGTIGVPTWSRPCGDATPALCQTECPCLPLSHGTGSITINYTITNTLKEKYFNCSTLVTVPSGSTLLRVMEVAEQKNPQIFSFQTEQTSWGPFVTSIHGLAASTDDRTYWKFLGDGKPLDEGVGTYKPHDGEHIEAVFSTY